MKSIRILSAGLGALDHLDDENRDDETPVDSRDDENLEDENRDSLVVVYFMLLCYI
jgi:hypothetical protein